MIQFLRCDGNHPDFIKLVEELDANLRERNGEMQKEYNQFNKTGDIPTAIVALDDHVPLGCGCFKNHGEHTAEIKRIYVRPDCRGKGIAKKMMTLLEEWAKELNDTRAVLETGKNQTEAIQLYQKVGYTRIENYGPYVDKENSVCFSKDLL